MVPPAQASQAWAASRASGHGCAASGGAKGGPGLPRPQWNRAVKAPPRPLRSGLGERATKAWRQPHGCGNRAAAALTPPPGRRRGARAAGLGPRRPESSRPGGGPGKDPAAASLAHQWASLRLPGLATPEMAAALRLPECNFDRRVPGRLPKATARKEERPKEKRGWGGGGDWERGSGVISTNWALS